MRALPLFLLCGWVGAAAVAEPLEIRAASAFPEGNRFSEPLEEFIADVNRIAAGQLHIRYLGGGNKVVNPYELGQYVRKGIVGVVSMPSAYYTNILPEASAIRLCDKSMGELRANGGWTFLNDLHERRMNVLYLAKVIDHIPFHLYLRNAPPPGVDLTGMRLRVTPVYRNFFEYMGASTQRSAPSEIFTLLERGVVDGLGWPLQGLRDFGLQSVLKYRVDPGFYRADIQILVNLDLWRRLDPGQRALLQQAGQRAETRAERFIDLNHDERREQAKVGIVEYALPPEQAKAWLTGADKAGWAEARDVNPQAADRFRRFCTSQAES